MPNGVNKGGTLLLIPSDAIELRGAESLDDARARIRQSVYMSADGRVTTAHLYVNGEVITLASVYAPVDGCERAQFFQRIERHLDKRTGLCIDANCVPDERLDLRRDAPTPYDNAGSKELGDATDRLDITDAARDAKGDDAHFTKSTVVVRGPPQRVMHTRIDQIYTPHIDGHIWSHTDHVDSLKDVGPWGHRAQRVDVVVAKEDRGHDLQSINERIFDDEGFVDSIVAAIQTMEADAASLSREMARLQQRAGRRSGRR